MDSGFVGAYFLKISLLQNLGKTEEARQIGQQLESRSAELNQFHKHYLRFELAKMNGQNAKAFQYFEDIYLLDTKDIFKNTSMAVYALEFMNDPEKALEVMNQVNYEKLDFNSCQYCYQQTHLRARAYIELRQYKKALQIIHQTPGYERNRLCRQFEIRALAGLQQYETIATLLEQLDKKQLNKDYRYLYFVAAYEAKLMGNEQATQSFSTQALQLYRDKPNRHMQMRCLYLLGDFAQANTLLEELWKPETPTYLYLSRLGCIGAIQQNREVAMASLQQLDRLDQTVAGSYIPYQQARIHSLLGQKDQAISYLKRALQRGRKYTPYTFQYDPDFVALHNYPPFRKLLKP